MGNRDLRFTDTDQSGGWSTYDRRNMKRDGRSEDTCDSGFDTLRSHGAGPAMESLFPDTIIDRGDNDVNVSTPMTGMSDRTRPRQLGQYRKPIPEIPPRLSPTRGTQPDLRFVDPSPTALAAGATDHACAITD